MNFVQRRWKWEKTIISPSPISSHVLRKFDLSRQGLLWKNEATSILGQQKINAPKPNSHNLIWLVLTVLQRNPQKSFNKIGEFFCWKSFISSDRSSCSDDGLSYIRAAATFSDFHSVHWCNWCYSCHSKLLKQYQCNWCDKMLVGQWVHWLRLLLERTSGAPTVIFSW